MLLLNFSLFASMTPENTIDTVQEPITNASPEVRTIIEKVLKLEKEKLYQRSPRNINDDILQIIKSVISKQDE